MYGDTVVALSTPPGESGIAVIRVTGSGSIDILEGMVPGSSKWPSHRGHNRALTGVDGEVIDEVLVMVMRAPNSYTGEDVVEISCHGNMQVVADITEDIVARGAKTAGPGEFTKRAYINGKIDLIQAEAVADLISSETKLQRRVALEHLEGGMSKKLRGIEEQLLEQLALVEVSIDFSEEDIITYDPLVLMNVAVDLKGRIHRLIDSEVAGRKLRKGLRVTILGPRNAGKSCLYNALLGEERAIVSPVPGTTRDILRERIHIGGFTYYLEDTAGIADAGCDIEAKGISIGRKAAEAADLVLFVVDGSEVLGEGVVEELSRIDRGKVLCILNKKDLGHAIQPDKAAGLLGVERVAVVSAKNKEGLEDLRQWIYSSTVNGRAGEISRERIAVNARQGVALREAEEALGRLGRALEEGAPAEILSVEIREAADACGKVTGRSISEELIDTIFSRFCIGK